MKNEKHVARAFYLFDYFNNFLIVVIVPLLSTHLHHTSEYFAVPIVPTSGLFY